MVTYTLSVADEVTPQMVIRHNEDGSTSYIPMDAANSDYQAYLNKDTLPSNSSIPQAGE